MFERLQFSIPITITIAAPVDIVWDCLCDIQSYSSILSSVISVESQPRAGSTISKGDGNTVKSNASVDDSTTKINNSNNRFLGSRWMITRISVLENQTYEAPVTITQHTITEQSRILTFSTHEMLGATCSLKLIVEPGRNINNDSSVRSTDEKGGGATSERRDSGASASSQSKQQQIIDVEEGAAGDTKEACCYLTVIMTMVPYRFFVKLLGVMCCICLLKWRARIAMECDLEDVTVYCEEKYEKQLKEREGGSKRGDEADVVEEGG